MDRCKTLLKKYPLILLAALMMWGIFAADIIAPDRVCSEMENRYLEQSPKMNLEALIDNQWTLQFEEYVNDQFIARDTWIDIKSRSEALLLKIENNDVIYGEEGYMFDKYTEYDEDRFVRNMGFVQTFVDSYDGHVTFALIPSSYAVLEEYLPRGAPNVDQLSIIRKETADLTGDNLTVLDMAEVLSAHKDEYIYYRTDHHWTTLGAYYGYDAYRYAWGRQAGQALINNSPAHTVEGFLGTYYSRCKKYDAQPDTITYFDIPLGSIDIPVPSDDIKDAEIRGLYNVQKFDTRDKYAAFLWGNNPLVILRGESYAYLENPSSARRLLIVKDSYANAMVPFLLADYDEIYVVDLRFYPGIQQLLDENTFADVLICYSFTQFAGDMNVMKLNQ